MVRREETEEVCEFTVGCGAEGGKGSVQMWNFFLFFPPLDGGREGGGGESCTVRIHIIGCI